MEQEETFFRLGLCLQIQVARLDQAIFLFRSLSSHLSWVACTHLPHQKQWRWGRLVACRLALFWKWRLEGEMGSEKGVEVWFKLHSVVSPSFDEASGLSLNSCPAAHWAPHLPCSPLAPL